ncbi:hypothetical protein Ciccas_005850 [Cichlidogyrus casuarinus]|uniref:Tetraspanin n=1 Tax=Cichlidogyrus casuarinus TaxID=1844966 RepID=A0ABD2Q7H3_9PLAT
MAARGGPMEPLANIDDTLRFSSPCTFHQFIIFGFGSINICLGLAHLTLIIASIYTFVEPPIYLLSSIADYSMIQIISDWSVLLVDSKMPLVTAALCVIGLAINIFGLVACIKASAKKCELKLTKIFVVLCGVLIFAWICLLIVYPLMPRFVDKTILDSHESFIRDYYQIEKPQEYVTAHWDRFQEVFRCCGIRNASIFKALKYKNESLAVVPFSCCKNLDVEDCTKHPTYHNSYINLPCEMYILDISRGANLTVKLVIGMAILMYLFLSIHALTILCEHELKRHYKQLRDLEKPKLLEEHKNE